MEIRLLLDNPNLDPFLTYPMDIIHAREWDSHLVLIVLLDMVLRMEYPYWTLDVIGCLLAIR